MKQKKKNPTYQTSPFFLMINKSTVGHKSHHTVTPIQLCFLFDFFLNSFPLWLLTLTSSLAEKLLLINQRCKSLNLSTTIQWKQKLLLNQETPAKILCAGFGVKFSFLFFSTQPVKTNMQKMEARFKIRHVETELGIRTSLDLASVSRQKGN